MFVLRLQLRTDDTLRKPLSRLLSITVTVIQASMQTHTHTYDESQAHTWALLGCNYYQLPVLKKV